MPITYEICGFTWESFILTWQELMLPGIGLVVGKNLAFNDYFFEFSTVGSF